MKAALLAVGGVSCRKLVSTCFRKRCLSILNILQKPDGEIDGLWALISGYDCGFVVTEDVMVFVFELGRFHVR